MALSARRSLVRGRAASDGAVMVVDRDDLRILVQRDSELSEILMRASSCDAWAMLARPASGGWPPRWARARSASSSFHRALQEV